jgi:hypothetical protein
MKKQRGERGKAGDPDSYQKERPVRRGQRETMN